MSPIRPEIYTRLAIQSIQNYSFCVWVTKQQRLNMTKVCVVAYTPKVKLLNLCLTEEVTAVIPFGRTELVRMRRHALCC